MARIIKLTPEVIDEVRQEFEETLSKARLTDGKISFTKTLTGINRKATVYFTELAWAKMQTLVRTFTKEVAWHGLAYRLGEPENDEYIIRDIIVYPQEVAAATVTTDQAKYEQWLIGLDNDTFNNVRMQGHSHVDFATNPSGVDTALYDGILSQLTDDMFYIFLIWNKKGDHWIKVYDMEKNIMFENSDIAVKVTLEGEDLDEFLKNAQGQVTERVYTPPATTATRAVAPAAANTKVVPVKEAGKSKFGFGKSKKMDAGTGRMNNSVWDEEDIYGYDDSPYWNGRNYWGGNYR